jgi:ribosomal protein S18 acetylase RimI-like enzyme
MHIRAIKSSERSLLLELAVATALFTPDEAEGLLGGVVEGIANQTLPAGHAAVACAPAEGAQPVGWAYFAPDALVEDVWNLWWIGVTPIAQGSGAGDALLRAAEGAAAAAGGRLLIIETNDLEPQARARRFYARNGYAECGHIPDFYRDGEAKVIFCRRIGSPNAV